MSYRNRVLLASLFLLFGKIRAQYCTNDDRYTDVQFFDSTEISNGANIQFGTALDHLGNSYTLRMDFYYPNLVVDTSSKRPFIMLFHGGGFSSGDKQSGDIQNLCVHLALRGFVTATVNYRLGYDFSEYGQYKARYRALQDGHAALRYVVNNANALRIDTSWLFVGGQSAGSLLALGMVYADQAELDSISLLYNATSVSAELGNLYTSGNNLTNTYSIKGIFNNWGGVTESEMDVEEMLPMVAFHGAKDTVVRINSDSSFLHYRLNGSSAIHDDLIANKICSEITIDTLGEHGVFRNASSLFRAKRASCFFKSIFCNSCSNFYSTDSIPANCSATLGVKEADHEFATKIYPNPFENTITIEGLEGIVNINVYNSFGQLVFQEENNTGIVDLNIPSGVYFLQIKKADSNTTHAFVVIRK